MTQLLRSSVAPWESQYYLLHRLLQRLNLLGLILAQIRDPVNAAIYEPALAREIRVRFSNALSPPVALSNCFCWKLHLLKRSPKHAARVGTTALQPYLIIKLFLAKTFRKTPPDQSLDNWHLYPERWLGRTHQEEDHTPAAPGALSPGGHSRGEGYFSRQQILGSKKVILGILKVKRFLQKSSQKNGIKKRRTLGVGV